MGGKELLCTSIIESNTKASISLSNVTLTLVELDLKFYTKLNIKNYFEFERG